MDSHVTTTYNSETDTFQTLIRTTFSTLTEKEFLSHCENMITAACTSLAEQLIKKHEQGIIARIDMQAVANLAVANVAASLGQRFLEQKK